MAGQNISTMSIQVGLDASPAERGLNRLGAALESFSESLKYLSNKNDILGPLAGNAIWDTMKAGIRGVTGAAEGLFNRLVDIGKQAMNAAASLERTKFQKDLDNGRSPAELVGSEEFNNSILGTIAKVSQAWRELMEWIGQKLQPVIKWLGDAMQGFIQGVGTALEVIINAFSDAFGGPDSPFKGVEDIFKTAFNLAVSTAKVIVEGARKFADLMGRLQLLGNPVARLAAEDEVALATGEKFGWFGRTFLGGIDQEEFDRRNAILQKRKGDIDAMNKLLEDQKGVDNLFGNIQAGLNRIEFKAPKKLNVAGLLDAAGLKAAEKADPKYDPQSVFAPLMERGSMADWKQSQVQQGAAMEAEALRVQKEQLKKQDDLIAAVREVKAAVGGINIGNPFGVVALAGAGGRK